MQNFLGLIYGIVYGVAHIVPGLSGGTFLVVFGCYDLVCEAFALNIKTIKKHFLFFVLFGIGTVGGIAGFAHAITYLLINFEIPLHLLFMGLILGGLPHIVQIATEEEKLRPMCALPFALGFALIVALFLFEKSYAFEMSALQETDFTFAVKIVLYSFVAAVAMVMPGISGAFVLVAFGVYDVFLGALSSLDFSVLIPATIGVLLGIVAGAKLILLTLKRYKLIVYSAILGIIIASVIPLFPAGIGLNAETLAGIVCFVLGIFIVARMGKGQENEAAAAS